MFLRRKKRQNALYVPKMLYLCTVKQENDIRSFILGYGVMVTQQILVLFFLVRIRVAQQKGVLSIQDTFFCYCFSFFILSFYFSIIRL